VNLGGRSVAARRMDGDANGTLTDPQDRLWIDQDEDGRWDPATEQFAYAPILTLGAQRLALRSDPLGERLALEPLQGTGTVALARLRLAGSTRAAELVVTLIGRDGSAVGLSAEGTASTVPIGEYRIHALTIRLEDPKGGAPWSYVFSDPGDRGERGWFTVAKDAQVVIDPIGRVELATGLGASSSTAAGDEVKVSPQLRVADGLLINTCFRGTPALVASDNGPTAEIALTTADGRPVTGTSSGFA
jgi:hypothetical protein